MGRWRMVDGACEHMTMYPEIQLNLPDWIEDFCASWEGEFDAVAGRMEFAIALSAANVERGTGGPFGAAVFDLERGELVAPGVNLVVPASNSVAHAEMVAIMEAEQIMGTHNLGVLGMPELELASSTEPCAMCMGAIPWSGIPRLVCGARHQDAESIGFDEGPKPADWRGEYARRGIEVCTDICRDEAITVLRSYFDAGGEIYKGGGREDAEV